MEKSLEDTFLEALTKNKESLLRVCSIYATDSESKKDLFQESLLNIWKSMPSFSNKSLLKTWMYRISLNVCLGIAKKRLKSKIDFVDVESIPAENYENPKTNISSDPRLEQLHKCLSKLNETDRALITLYLEELPYKEIANITGLTENLGNSCRRQSSFLSTGQ